MMGPEGKWVDMQMDSRLSDNTSLNAPAASASPGREQREPGSPGFLDTELSPTTLHMSSHFGGVGSACPSFQLWIGTLAKYPQNIGLEKSSYKIE